MPVPDIIAVSGRLNRGALEFKFKSESTQLVDVEALRYMYLSDEPESVESRGSAAKREEVVVCMLGLYFQKDTFELLSFAKDCVGLLGSQSGVKWKIKFHPLCDMRAPLEKLFGESVLIDRRPVGEALKGVDIVLTSGPTSAVLDAAALGKKVVVYDCGNDLPASPLYGTDLADFVVCASDFVEIVDMYCLGPGKSTPNKRDLFNIDESLGKWLSLLHQSWS